MVLEVGLGCFCLMDLSLGAPGNVGGWRLGCS